MRKVKAFFAKVLGPGKFQMTRISLFAIFISFLVGVILLLSLGKNPFSAYLNLLQGAGFFAKKSYAGHQGQFSDFMSFLDYLTPMIFAALGVAVGNKAGLFNIGISGQMIVAGFVASITVGIGCTLPSYVAKPLVIIIGAICGAGMGALIGWLKYKFNINEVVSSIMLNYIARYIIAFFINTFYVDPITRQSKKIADAANSEYILPWTRQACLDAYKRAGLTVDDIDVFETHDCFTSSEYAAISAFGLTEPGREYEAIENGMVAFKGRKPINPSGGLIGCGHPVGASGARMILDIYKQVSGLAGDYQIKNVRNAMMLNIGGSATTNYTFIVGVEI